MEARPDSITEANRLDAPAAHHAQTAKRLQAYKTYCKMLHPALRKDPARAESDLLLRLYPIIYSINDELDAPDRGSEALTEEQRMEPIYEAADKLVDAFADILDLRDAMPAPIFERIRELLIEWFGEDGLDFRLVGEPLKEHSLRPTLGDAVIEHMLKMAV